jgi:hypothetical protein
MSTADRLSVEKNLIQLSNQNNLIAKKLDIKQPIQAKELNQTQLNPTTNTLSSQIRPSSLGKVLTKSGLPESTQSPQKQQDPSLRTNSNNTPFSNKTTATTATSDYLKDENMQSPKI